MQTVEHHVQNHSHRKTKKGKIQFKTLRYLNKPRLKKSVTISTKKKKKKEHKNQKLTVDRDQFYLKVQG